MANELGDPIRWEGYQLAEKRSWVVNAPGAEVTWGAQDTLRAVGERFAGSDQALRDALVSLGGGWHGSAAERAGGALRAAATWSSGAGAAGAPGGKAVEGYGSSFEGLKARIPEPSTLGVWDMAKQGAANALSSGLGTFVVQSDISNVVQQNVQHDHEANLALRAHEQTTRDTVGSFPALDNPPSVTAPGDTGGGSGGAEGGARLGGAEVPTVAAAADVVPVGGAGPPGAGVGSAGAVAGPGAASSFGGAVVDPSTPAGRSNRNSPGWPPSPGPNSGGAGRGGSLRPPGGSTPGGRSRSPAEPVTGRAGTTAAAGRGAPASTPPWLTGTGGTGGRSNEREHRRRYWVPTDEAFDVMPPHVPPVLGEE